MYAFINDLLILSLFVCATSLQDLALDFDFSQYGVCVVYHDISEWLCIGLVESMVKPGR